MRVRSSGAHFENVMSNFVFSKRNSWPAELGFVFNVMGRGCVRMKPGVIGSTVPVGLPSFACSLLGYPIFGYWTVLTQECYSGLAELQSLVPPDFLAFLLLWLVISICMHFTRFKIR
jgi:hypothetical protein